MLETKSDTLVSVVFWLECLAAANANVICLFSGESGQVGAQGWEVQSCNLLVQKLGQEVNLVLVLLGLLPVVQQVNLGKSLIGERARHNKRRVASGASQIQQTAAGQDDHAVTIREHESVHLRLDVLDLDALHTLDSSHVDLVVKVTNVADDGIVLHLLHVLEGGDAENELLGEAENIGVATLYV